MTNTIQRKRCPHCGQSRPIYLIASHRKQCAEIMVQLQRERQQEVRAELERIRNE